DAVVDGGADGLCQRNIRHDAEAGDDGVGLQRAAIIERQRHAYAALLAAGDAAAGSHLDAVAVVVAFEEVAERIGIHARAEHVLGEHHRHAAAVHGQRGGDLAADEATADHRDVGVGPGQLAQAAVVVDAAVGEHAI